MVFPLQVPLLAGATVLLFVVADLIARQLARWVATKRAGARPVAPAMVPAIVNIQQQMAGMAARLVGTGGLVAALAASSSPHRFALVFTVAATYFAAALLDGVVRYRVAAAAGRVSR
jgi:hypothetical protein